MKMQWMFLLGIVFAILVSIFVVFYVDPVSVNYMFGETDFPLILVILGSVLMGGIIVGSIGSVKICALKRRVKHLEKEHPEEVLPVEVKEQ